MYTWKHQPAYLFIYGIPPPPSFPRAGMLRLQSPQTLSQNKELLGPEHTEHSPLAIPQVKCLEMLITFVL